MRSRPSLLPHASVLALGTALALAPTPLKAQAFQGTPTTIGGSVNFSRTTPGSETVIVQTSQAVVNWTPNDTTGTGDLIFLPSGNSVSFVAGSGVGPSGQYTILNRILAADPSRRIVLDGNVTSAPGGALWFYAPGGILLGANAQFNIGSLLLTANDPVRDANNGFLSGGAFALKAATGSTAAVEIAQTAQIKALAENSYVLAVAPRIDQGGSIQVNGTAALVAGEEIAFNYNAGLFDITVGQGTSATGNVILHGGTITGPASTGFGDFHRIYMVAVPKNDAITMFVQAGGDLGFDIAGKADVVGNAIVLSGGHNISDLGFNDPTATPAVGTGSVGVNVARGNYTSGLVGRSSDRIEVGDFNPVGTPDISFAGGVVLTAPESARVVAERGAVTIAGDLILTADATASSPDGSSRLAGNVLVAARGPGSSLLVAGNTRLSAIGSGGASLSGPGGGGTGGEASVHSSGGSVQLGGRLEIDADGLGGGGISASGDGNGGLGQIQVFNSGGSIKVAGDVDVSVDGLSNFASDAAGVGGAGRGGIVRVTTVAGSSIELAGNVSARARGIGGGGGNSAGGAGGLGTGGEIGLFSSGNIALPLAGSLVQLLATGNSGSGNASATATGGRVNVQAFGGALSTASALDIDVSANAGLSFAAPGADALGGSVFVEVFGGTGGSLNVDGDLSITADARAGSVSFSSAAGGTATGGVARIAADSGTVTLGSTVRSSAGASGGDGGAGGAATGGKVSFDAKDATITAGDTVTLIADAEGGNGLIGSAGSGGAGGNATGGEVFVSASTGATSSRVELKDLQVFSFASGGDGGDGAPGLAGGRGGDATGGKLQLIAQAGNGGITIGVADVQLSAFAGSGGRGGDDLSATGGQGGAGGNAVGGFTNFGTASGPELPSLAGFARFETLNGSASAFGGTGGDGGAGQVGGTGGVGGTGTGGNFVLLARGSEVTGGIADLEANGLGGIGGLGQNGAADGAGGAGQGGRAGLIASAHFVNGGPVNVTLNSLFATADGFGGSGQESAAGSGTGGIASIELVQNGPVVNVTGNVTITGDISLGAIGSGGSTDKGQAGLGQGGTATVIATKGTVNFGADLTLTALGSGGLTTTGTAGAGVGGSAEVVLDSGSLAVVGNTSLDANGNGGFTFDAGVGGDGTGGKASTRMDVNGGSLSFAALSVEANGIGGAGVSAGGKGQGGSVLVASGGGGSLSVSSGLTAEATADGGDAFSGVGGSAQGGSVTIGARTGRAEFKGDIFAITLASGGFADTGTAGDGIGGTTILDTLGGEAVAFGQVLLNAAAFGGTSADGSGGLGRGGTTRVFAGAAGDGITIGGISTLDSDGTGGDSAGAGKVGGAGEGGFANVSAGFGNVNLGNSLTLSATGSGGVGALGGLGAGGQAAAGAFNDGVLNVAAFVFQNATGRGGDAIDGLGGSGGTGKGGTATLSVDDPNVTNRLNVNDAFQFASGEGGGGGDGAAGQAGGRGGEGIGGLVRSGAGTNSGDVKIGQLSQSAFGVGGTGGTGGAGAVGGDGGIGRGGRVGVGNEPNPSSLTGTYFWEEVTGDASGFGGEGGIGGSGAAGGAGGAGFGGVATAGISGGEMKISGFLSRVASGFGGSGGAGTIQGQGGAGTGGEALVAVTPHPTQGGVTKLTTPSASLIASGFGGLGAQVGVSTAGFAVASARGGVLEIGSLSLEASGGAPAVPSTFGFVASGLSANGGQLSIGSDVTGTFEGDVGLAAGNNGTITIAGVLDLETKTNVIGQIGALAPPVPGTVSVAGDLTLSAGGGINTPADLQASSILLSAQQGVVTGKLTATNSLSVSGSSISTGTVTGGAGVSRLISPNNLTVGDITSPGDLELQAGGALTAGKLDAARNLVLLANGSLTTGGIRTGPTGNVLIADASMAGLIGTGSATPDYSALLAATPVRVTGSVSVGGSIETGTLKIAASGPVSLQGPANLTAAALIDSGGVASFSSTFAAAQITVRSADIEIGANGALGGPGTTQLRLEVDPAATAVSVGGPASPGWSLSGAEVARLRGQNIAISSNLASIPVRLGAATLSGSAAANPNLFGATASFSLSTPASIRVTGRFVIEGAALTDTLRLTANRIEVVPDAGGAIELLNASGNSGVLELEGADIWAADASLLAQLASNPAFAGRDAALAATPGSPNLAGSLGAGTIRATVGNSLLVQNSGSPAQRAGFSAGAGGVRVMAATGGTSPVDVTLNGRIQTATGSLTNDRTVEALTLVPASSGRGFAASSSVNGCVIGASCAPSGPSDPVVQVVQAVAPNIVGVLDQIELAPASDEVAAEKLPTVIANRLINAEPMRDAPPIDEPVTSGGNNSSWSINGQPGDDE